MPTINGQPFFTHSGYYGIKIDPVKNTCVVYDTHGTRHTCTWDDAADGIIDNIVGDAKLLRAALRAWDGPDEFLATARQLRSRGRS